MSESAFIKYYNTEIGDNNWSIYVGGERYSPAYPVKIVKRYLVIDSSENWDYADVYQNIYPLSILEAFVNENDETIEFDGTTYYLWKAYMQRGENSVPETTTWTTSDAKLYLLTTTLEPKLPLTEDSPEIAYFITSDDDDVKDYMMSKHICLAQVNEYNTGERKVRMANVKVRMYNFEHEENVGRIYEADEVADFFQYNGETMMWEGRLCYVWYRYDNNERCTIDGIHVDWRTGTSYKMQKLLTNTIWINNFPFSENSPEFVALINYEIDNYQSLTDAPFDRIEYFFDSVYEPTPINMTYTEEKITLNLNVRTTLMTDNLVDGEWYDYYTYKGDTMRWNGKLCYVWILSDNYGSYDYIHKVLTNTLDIQLPLNSHSPEYVATLNDYDSIAEYDRNSMRWGVSLSRTDMAVGPPVYIIKKVILVK